MDGPFACDALLTNSGDATSNPWVDNESAGKKERHKQFPSSPLHFTSFCLPPSASRPNNEGPLTYDVQISYVFTCPFLFQIQNQATALVFFTGICQSGDRSVKTNPTSTMVFFQQIVNSPKTNWPNFDSIISQLIRKPIHQCHSWTYSDPTILHLNKFQFNNMH